MDFGYNVSKGGGSHIGRIIKRNLAQSESNISYLKNSKEEKTLMKESQQKENNASTKSQHIVNTLSQIPNPHGMILSGFIKRDNSILRAMLFQNIDFTSCIIYELMLSHRNTSTNECFPTQELLAREANCSERTVIRSIKLLEQAGYIHVIRPFANQSNRYCFPHEAFYTVEAEKKLFYKYCPDANRTTISSAKASNKDSAKASCEDEQLAQTPTLKADSPALKTKTPTLQAEGASESEGIKSESVDDGFKF